MITKKEITADGRNGGVPRQRDVRNGGDRYLFLKTNFLSLPLRPARRYGEPAATVTRRLVFSLLFLACAHAQAYPSPAFAAPHAVHARDISIGDMAFTGVFPRIFTPNSDGYNDKAVFHFTNPEQLPITGKIYDISGAEVASLTPGSDPTELLLWDGKDSGSRVVPGGIYLFKIEFQGKDITGTVVVAR